MPDPAPHSRDSVWMATSSAPARPRLEGEHRFDVAVVGAGITGTTTALLLKRAGLRVALVEAGEVCRGVTGSTTAKVTSLHQLVYADLASRFDEATARTYGQANEEALATVVRLVGELGIDCDLERRPALTYTREPERVEAVRREAEVAARLGLPASFTTDSDLPFPIAGGVRFADQAQLHPRRYVLGLADAVDGDGSAVFERSPVVDVREGARIATPDGAVECQAVVLATHLPILDRGFFFAKAHPTRSYAIAAALDGPVPETMAISVEAPTRSVRSCLVDGERLLIVGGESHKPGDDEDETRHWAALEAWAREHLPVRAVVHRWSAHDYVPVDKLPYIGPLTRSSGTLWTATGFRKWGMTGGTVAALLLAELIQGRDSAWASVFDPNRLTPAQSVRSFVSENLDVARHFVVDRLEAQTYDAVDRLEPGQGAVVRVGGEAYAVSADEDGRLTSVSPVCTHLGCHVHWNTAERSWDCPCHGSRYSPSGGVLQGPAVRDLEPKPLPPTPDPPPLT